jgi:hypothetical protein
MTMNWEAIGAVGELIGGAAVFISLLYLAVQIRSSRRSDQIVAAAQAASAVDEWIGQIVRDEDLFKLYRQGMSDYESLSREEKGRFGMLILQFLRSTEAIWFHVRLGAIEPAYWASMKTSIGLIVNSIGGSRSFERNRMTLSPEFVSVVQEILVETDSTE